MKIVIPTFIVLGLALIIFNAFRLDFQDLLRGDSLIAVICILAAACVILLMVILWQSRRVAKKMK